MVFGKEEGTTLVLDRAEAQAARLDGVFPCCMITLTIHSSLEAVGFLAAITARLGAADISVNAMSASHHDRLFVPAARVEEAAV